MKVADYLKIFLQHLKTKFGKLYEKDSTVVEDDDIQSLLRAPAQTPFEKLQIFMVTYKALLLTRAQKNDRKLFFKLKKMLETQLEA